LFQPKENAKVIGELKPKKAPGGDLITSKVIIELPNFKKENEKIYYHNDTEARKRPHNSVILQTNKFIIVSV